MKIAYSKRIQYNFLLLVFTPVFPATTPHTYLRRVLPSGASMSKNKICLSPLYPLFHKDPSVGALKNVPSLLILVQRLNLLTRKRWITLLTSGTNTVRGISHEIWYLWRLPFLTYRLLTIHLRPTAELKFILRNFISVQKRRFLAFVICYVGDKSLEMGC